jgi:DNA-directed RNA polymerase subunit M/transcription elongation factor TFIIS
MAKGKNCPSCSHPMYAADVKEASKGSWIVYVCRSCGFREKVFESK